jgi:hypothetical protein
VPINKVIFWIAIVFSVLYVASVLSYDIPGNNIISNGIKSIAGYVKGSGTTTSSSVPSTEQPVKDITSTPTYDPNVPTVVLS